ncbi:AdoMet_MTases domain containing protein [uncultured Caudovirales phage]|uniref:AdoMet_MTases domain containing protein n=1 Tax=uncultured Caudovirales phage TaxID=2100421 RepID=A0A6J5N8S6_9CAUD|nr:AdoMet_MTases domain containing protein [uncultured Caudovirales phage]
MAYTVLQGNNIDVLKTYPDDHFDSIVTDPPYGIDFLGKDWDANTGALETYEECLRVLKPGGHILAFSAARTYHHLAITLEQAGFEIRDQIMWIYSSGFPKSQDIGRSIQRSLGVKEKKAHKHNIPRNGGAGDTKHYESDGQIVVTDLEALQWEGWGTALKPAHEPIALARKPLGKNLSIAKNAQQWGVGALNIDATRVGDEVITTVIKKSEDNSRWYKHSKEEENIPKEVDRQDNVGRFPSNVLGEILQEDYQKYFYSPKVSRKERHIGFDFDKMPTIGNNNGNPMGQLAGDKNSSLKTVEENTSDVGNNHPTVKPVALMEYLIKLVTPPGGLVLDPFNGSGSTGMAAVGLGYDYVGIDLDPKYVEISLNRIAAWINKDEPKINPKFNELFEDN